MVESNVNVFRDVARSVGRVGLGAWGAPSVVSWAKGVKRKRGRPPSEGAVVYRYQPSGAHVTDVTSRSRALVRMRGWERPSSAKSPISAGASLEGASDSTRKATVLPSVVTEGEVRVWFSMRSRRRSRGVFRSATYRLRRRTRSGDSFVAGIPLTTTCSPPGSQSAWP
ncbi:hypothetical protein SARU107417_13600 [Salinibacter ruber]